MSAPRVLIVDDCPELVELAAFVLEAADCAVDAVTEATDVIDRVARFRPDLILMDVLMPRMNGIELTCRLKADPGTRHIVVIAFTALAMKGDEARMRQAGCDGYIAKPFDVASLAETIRSHLAHVVG